MFETAVTEQELAAPLFDAAYYRAIRPDLDGTDADLLQHYVRHGWRERSQPHPLFDPSYVQWQWGEELGAGEEPFGRYLAGRWREVRSPHPLFDTELYRRRYPGLDQELLAHYQQQGWRDGASPHGLFDPGFYRSQAGIGEQEDPARHYMMAGWRGGLAPHPLFDPAHYLAQRADVAGADPLSHYVQFGSHEGVEPHPLFDPAHYRRQVPALDEDPLLHYLHTGGTSGLSPHPLFDVAFYRAQLGRVPDGPDLPDYLAHAGLQTVSPCPLFDESWYRQTVLDGAMRPGLLHYLREGWYEGCEPHPCFDSVFYRQQSAGLAEAPLRHFRKVGEAAGLRPNAVFSGAFYRMMQPGAVPQDGSPFEHYILTGEAEGRAASPAFRPRRYRSRYLAYAPATSPMRHFMLTGQVHVMPAPQDPVAALRARTPQGEAAPPCVIVLLGPADAEARAAVWEEWAVEPRPKSGPRRCALGWVIEAETLAQLRPALDALRGKPGAAPVLLLWGAVFMTRGDVSLLLAAGMAAHPTMLDRALDVRHAGYTVRGGTAYPDGTGEDPEHPALARNRTAVTAGPVLALPSLKLPDPMPESMDELFIMLSAGARFVPGAVACVLDAVVGGPPPGPVPARLPNDPVRPRLLMIDSIVPRFAFDAGSYYALQLMQMYQRFGYDVTFLPDAEMTAPRHAAEAVAALGIEIVQAPFAQSSAGFIQGAPGEYEVLLLSRYDCGGRHAAAAQDRWPGAKTVFHPGDLHYLRELRQAVLREDVGQFARALDMKRWEMEVVARADMTVVVSDHELGVLRTAGFADRVVKVEPAFANRHPAPYDPAARHGVAFIGGYGHQPNVDAAEFLCTEIWPLVTAIHPGITLHIVGSAAPDSFQSYASEDVVIEGRVEDLDGLLDRLRLTVAPLRFGAGVKMKLVSSLAAGVPVVCTPIAAEGLGLAPGEGLVLAEDASAIAAAIAAIYDDPVRLSALSSSGFSAISSRYSPAAAEAAYRAALGPILGLP